MASTRKKILWLATLFGVIGVGLVVVLPATYMQTISPNGRFTAVATYPAWRQFVPALPGQGGDRPGAITIYATDGRSCGRVHVSMVSSIYDLAWTETTAELRLVAQWDLLHCRVTSLK